MDQDGVDKTAAGTQVSLSPESKMSIGGPGAGSRQRSWSSSPCPACPSVYRKAPVPSRRPLASYQAAGRSGPPPWRGATVKLSVGAGAERVNQRARWIDRGGEEASAPIDPAVRCSTRTRRDRVLEHWRTTQRQCSRDGRDAGLPKSGLLKSGDEKPGSDSAVSAFCSSACPSASSRPGEASEATGEAASRHSMSRRLACRDGNIPFSRSAWCHARWAVDTAADRSSV